MRTRPTRFFGDRTMSAPATAGAFVAIALVTGLGIAFTNAEGLVAKGFTTALSASNLSKSGMGGSEALVSGSEEYWLADPARKTAANGGEVQPAAWTPLPAALGVEVGDRIMIKSGKTQRTLEVVEVAEVPASATRIETGQALGHPVLVTCRDTADQSGQLVRFVTNAGQSATGTPAKTQRTL